MSQPMKLFLAVSLLLNLLLGGVILGHASHRFMRDHRQHAAESVATLPAEKRQLFEAAMQRVEQESGDLHEQISDARKEAASLLKAEPFNKAGYLAQIQHIHELRGQMMMHTAEAVAELATRFTPEERAVLATMLAEMFHHPRPAPPGASPSPGETPPPAQP